MDVKTAKINEILETLYPAECSLDFGGDAYRLLIMTRLAAQCTDVRVNKVSEALFAEFPTISSLADAPIDRVEEIVHPCGVYRVKARDIKAICQKLIADYGSVVPDEMEELLKLPGVGRKTANLVLSEIFKKPAVVTDTHCIRLSNRLGLCDSKNPAVVEKTLAKLLDPAIQADFCHRLVFHGRAICRARSPKCSECELRDYCAHN